ncbi:MAG: MerR family transcriptional regulator, partial [Clostridia bacterium]|nr:MerR family transcriptional regulator [Clostridia bacterium]
MDTINNLIKITELTRDLNISSRTLRYCEQVGLIKSVRPKFEAYRYYDDEAIERLHQI